MRNLFILFIVAAPMLLLRAQKKDISLENIWKEYQFFSKRVPGFNFMESGKHYSKELLGSQILEYELSSGKKSGTIFSAEEGFQFSSYEFSDDEKKILFESDVEKIYRHSSRANFHVWDRDTKKMTAVSKEGKQRYARFNPTADKVAFVRGNNLYYKDLKTNKEVQITEDGEFNKIINGATDWVYEEEFAMSRAFSWSPDGKKIAFIRFDESKVPEFTMFYYNNDLYPQASTFKYPKAGEVNSIVSVHVYHLDKDEVKDINIKGDPDQYIPRITWTADNKLCITQLNRLQNELNLLIANPEKGKVKTLLTEKSEFFIDITDNLTFLKEDLFVWTSDADGWQHIYLYDMKGKQVRQLTKGAFDVTDFYGVDEKNGRIYFQAAAKTPMDREVYYVELKGGEMVNLSPKEGVNSAQFSSTFEYYVLQNSTATRPATHKVFVSKTNKEVRSLEENKALVTRLEEYNLGSHEFIKVKNSNGDELNGWMIKPADFDPKKKYPVFMTAYGGPGHQTVMNQWSDGNNMWFQMLAQLGYLVVSVDNRGTDARGEAFRKSTYLELGKYETTDQIDVAKWLASQDYVDGSRIGIFGWSFGGYLSTLCLAKGANAFKMAIAVAPVTNWKWYDTIYTERYMRTPKENDGGYENNSPVNFADKIKGDYLLVHGMADDNVHFQHAVEMANALVTHNIPFEQAFYPNKNHGIYGGYTRLHLYQKMTKFIKEKL